MNEFQELPMSGRLYLTKYNLIKAAMLAEEHAFNRQLTTETLGQVPDFNYPIMHVFAHFHRQGEPCAEHRRLEVWLAAPGADLLKAGASGGLIPHTVDVPMDFFKMLCLQCGVTEVTEASAAGAKP